jgi:hypothetical protein
VDVPFDLVNKTAAEIDNLKVEKEKELQAAQANLYEVEIKELQIAKQIIDLQSQRKDLQIVASKARHIVRTLGLDIKIYTSAFWSAKNGL